MPPRSLAALIEGDGDYESVPLLIRNVAAAKHYFDLVIGTKPIKVGDLVSILQSEKFLRLFQYAALRDDVDAVLIVADCEDHCHIQAVQQIYNRIADIVARSCKPVGIVLFVKEYETMFLANGAHIAGRCRTVQLDVTNHDDISKLLQIRNAKGYLAASIVGSSYKETRDQARLTAAMDVLHCAERYRPLKHLINVIDWLYSWDGKRQFY